MRYFLDKMWTLFFKIRYLGTFQIEDGLAFTSESTCPQGVNSSLMGYLEANAEEETIKLKRNETRKPFLTLENKQICRLKRDYLSLPVIFFFFKLGGQKQL